MGIDWDTVLQHVAVDKVSVYAGSAMGQLDGAGAGGMIKARYNGQRVTSKYCPLGLAEMPADFVNAYVLGSLGNTGASMGACASFLYNLRHGIDDIRSGRARVAFIGAAEAPITPEIMEGYVAMGALATDKGLRQLDGLDAGIDQDAGQAGHGQALDEASEEKHADGYEDAGEYVGPTRLTTHLFDKGGAGKRTADGYTADKTGGAGDNDFLFTVLHRA